MSGRCSTDLERCCQCTAFSIFQMAPDWSATGCWHKCAEKHQTRVSRWLPNWAVGLLDEKCYWPSSLLESSYWCTEGPHRWWDEASRRTGSDLLQPDWARQVRAVRNKMKESNCPGIVEKGKESLFSMTISLGVIVFLNAPQKIITRIRTCIFL